MWLGIDFGTSSTRASIFKDGNAADLLLNGKSAIMPSAIYLNENEELVVGQAAVNSRKRDPTRYHSEFKRLLGRKEPILLGEKQFYPEDLIRAIFADVKRKAEDQQGDQISRLVLTVPITYTSDKKTRMEKSALEAGFDTVKIISEPESAAIYSAWVNTLTGNLLQDDQIALVFDFGGGTFDAALLKKRGPNYVFVGEASGLEKCGGMDIDRIIYDDIKSQAKGSLKSLIDHTNLETIAIRTRNNIADKSKEFKHELSIRNRAGTDELMPGSFDHSYFITRPNFEIMIEPLVRACIDKSLEMLKRAQLEWNDIAHILMVGGSCRIPLVKQLLEKSSGRPVILAEEPEMAVSRGAAIWGANNQQVFLETSMMFSSDHFEETIRQFCLHAGFKAKSYEKEKKMFRIIPVETRNIELFISIFGKTIEFSIPVSTQNKYFDELVHQHSSIILRISAKPKYYFFCLKEINGAFQYNVMHNIEFSLMDFEIFKKIVENMVAGHDRLRDILSTKSFTPPFNF